VIGARTGVAGKVFSPFITFKALIITLIETKGELSSDKTIPKTSPSKFRTIDPLFDFATLIFISLFPSKINEDIVLPEIKIFCPIFIFSKSPKLGTVKLTLFFSSSGAPIFRKAKPILSIETNSALNFPLSFFTK
jgi:hypothetical protein